MKRIYLIAVTIGILTLSSCAGSSGWSCSKRYCQADEHRLPPNTSSSTTVNT